MLRCVTSWNMLPVTAHLAGQMMCRNVRRKWFKPDDVRGLQSKPCWTSFIDFGWKTAAPKPNWWMRRHAVTWTGNNENCLLGDPTCSPTTRRGGDGGSRFSVTWLAVASITSRLSSWTLPVNAAAVTSSITQSAGVTDRVWRQGGITTQRGIHLDCPDEHPFSLAAPTPRTHRWFGDTYSHFSELAACSRGPVWAGPH